MTNAKFFGFFTVNTNGSKSVQVVDGSERVGFATEKTARVKVAARVASNKHAVNSGHVCRFDNTQEMLKYLNEANRMVRDEP